MAGNLIGESLRFWRLAVDYLDDRRRSRATVREFNALGPEECAHALSDSGVTPVEFDRAMRLPFASEDLLAPAMRSVGIDPAAFAAQNPSSYRDLCRTCMLCDHRMRCRNDLGSSDFARTHVGFCPNSETFGDLGEGPEARSGKRPN
jgi:hypothetical protein